MYYIRYLQITKMFPKRLKFIKQTIGIVNVNNYPMEQEYLKYGNLLFLSRRFFSLCGTVVRGSAYIN
jgi:hypothetical protein